ncbi:MAG: iron ABC transporter permease [Firmicutes bacterium]|jgi:iron complex transport system permease protein|nr:iron ABC transporter permease [Bacillota bacterium]
MWHGIKLQNETASLEKSQRLRRYARYNLVFVLLIVAFVLITILNINSGSVNISVKEIAKIIFLRQGDDMAYSIIWKIRLPRIITSALLGGGLALAGFLLQTFFNNPIAGPFVLGISSGAKLIVAVTMIVLIQYVNSISAFTMVAAAFVGALISMGFVLLASRKVHQMSMLLVTGIMISYICSAITEFLITFAKDTDIVNLHNWSQGSFSGMDWDNVWMCFIIITLTFGATFLLAKPISAYQMGESYAQSMGVNIKRFRVILILLSSLLAGCVTAFAGPISFVGIAVPHLAKIFLNTAKPIVVIPATFIGGGVFCMLCDYIARTAFAPTELSISTVTAIFGAPIVIAMLLKKQNNH